ncbi:hypothetical protein M3194_16550 [Paenibacillus glycanilyticus]|uniref:hypothetical protein n=1 Tax=Paenibacillus glycanilyticus TaxID=126569 RepID=UPI002041F2ED|nr:hypothetical protein [Paenibacillus glycanilyticus]MCM3628957.1 hypothetical protein [Paenibacillus glycanilyticus]
MDCERLYGIRLPKFTPEQTPEPLKQLCRGKVGKVRFPPLTGLEGLSLRLRSKQEESAIRIRVVTRSFVPYGEGGLFLLIEIQ